jgi:methyltransferase family protein
MGLRTTTRKFIARKLYPMKIYEPVKKSIPENIIQVNSAWKGLELIIEDILDRFEIGRDKCIEFGTEYCYSTVVLSSYFKKVSGIDLFTGDQHSGHKLDHYSETLSSVAKFKNIELIKSDYRDYIKRDNEQYDFAHVDIIHSYEETYECGLWAVEHSKCCIFHDTESFPAVRKAVYNIAKQTGKEIYNYPYHHGLGIIV